MGNTIIKGFVNSRRTHFVYQPAIGSFYEGGQYSFKELLSARDPWSGWIHDDAGLDVLRHFTLRRLGYGSHTVQMKVVSGTLVVDALGVAP